MADKIPQKTVTFWDSGLGHTVRDAAVAFGTTLLLVLLDWVQGVKLSGQWAQFAFIIPIVVTAVKGYFHLKDPNLTNLPTPPAK